MTYEDVINELNNKIYKPVYLLFGEESYFIDAISNYIAKNVLTDAEKSFNQTILYGKDANVTNIIEVCRRFPMMSNYQVIIIKEAQDLKKFKDLDVYLANPLKTTILVLNFKYTKKIDGKLNFYKHIKKNGVVFESKKLYERQVYQWINAYLKETGKTIHPEALRLLYESVGADLSRLANNLNKLKISMPQDKTQIQTDDIAVNIGVHRDFNVFELQKALGMKDSIRVYKIIDYFAKDSKNNPLVFSIAQIFEYFLKIIKYHILKDKSKNNIAAELGISPFFTDEYSNAARNYSLKKLVNIISYIRECDLKSKGVGASSISEGDLLKELAYKILH